MVPIKLDPAVCKNLAPWQAAGLMQFNGHDVMIVRAEGDYPWHRHDDTDDFFLVLDGRLRIELRDRVVELGPGELFIVPRGVEHRPVAMEGGAHFLLIEPATAKDAST